MQEFGIRLRSVQDVQDFVALATNQPFAVNVGTREHFVNGKSFMEMFCLNLTRTLKVTVECSPAEFERFHSAAQRFLEK